MVELRPWASWRRCSRCSVPPRPVRYLEVLAAVRTRPCDVAIRTSMPRRRGRRPPRSSRPRPHRHQAVRVPPPVVEVDEEDERGPGGAFVALGKRVIPGKAAAKHRCLVDDGRVEVLIAEASGRSALSARSIRDAVARIAASTPVTCSASQRYSARSRYRVTLPIDRAAPCRVRGVVSPVA